MDMITATKRFLLVDDDPVANILSKMILKRIFGEVHVDDFLVPEKALEYIENNFEEEEESEKTILLLDINMPTLSGWDFLEIFDRLDDKIKNQFNVYMLSSSIDLVDINHSKLNSLVVDYIEKPLDKTTLINMFS